MRLGEKPRSTERGYMGSALGRIRIASVAVALADAAILVMDAQLGFLIVADLPTVVGRVLLRIEVPRGTLAAATLDIPSAIGVRHHMMGAWSALIRHILIPSRHSKIKSIATPNSIWVCTCVLSRTAYTATLNKADLESGEHDVTTPLGDKIRDLRKAKGYTLDKLAELADSSKSYIWELENKNPPRPSADKVAKIAAVLGVTADYLIDTTEKVGLDDATDNAFFRKYRKMDAATKDKIRRMTDLLGNDE